MGYAPDRLADVAHRRRGQSWRPAISGAERCWRSALDSGDLMQTIRLSGRLPARRVNFDGLDRLRFRSTGRGGARAVLGQPRPRRKRAKAGNTFFHRLAISESGRRDHASVVLFRQDALRRHRIVIASTRPPRQDQANWAKERSPAAPDLVVGRRGRLLDASADRSI